MTTIRLSAEVIEQFKAAGAGWQTKIDLALKDWLLTHRP
ncbi:BrnA antitoxin family protein [Polynucleobacter paneuropaeus]|nr:BrnA antitoxin family protein [Polynucleobacter paneuropaeus]